MESELYDVLAKFGCTNLKETNDRFVDDKAFYLTIVSDMLNDAGFEQLKQPLLEKDADTAFDIAHSLKGIIGECGDTPLYHTICAIVEPLRVGNANNLSTMYDLLLSQREAWKELLQSTWKKE